MGVLSHAIVATLAWCALLGGAGVLPGQCSITIHAHCFFLPAHGFRTRAQNLCNNNLQLVTKTFVIAPTPQCTCTPTATVTCGAAASPAAAPPICCGIRWPPPTEPQTCQAPPTGPPNSGSQPQGHKVRLWGLVLNLRRCGAVAWAHVSLQWGVGGWGLGAQQKGAGRQCTCAA